MNSVKINPKFTNLAHPRIGLIALATDFRIEKDFISVIKDQNIDFFVNRIHCYFPLTSENLIKMSSAVTEIVTNLKQDRPKQIRWMERQRRYLSFPYSTPPRIAKLGSGERSARVGRMS